MKYYEQKVASFWAFVKLKIALKEMGKRIGSSRAFLKIKGFLKKHGYKALVIWIIWNILKFTVVVKLIDLLFVK
ncbi:MAG: hypothetical protein AAF806_08615 [Bacteroidota bacterium]